MRTDLFLRAISSAVANTLSAGASRLHRGEVVAGPAIVRPFGHLLDAAQCLAGDEHPLRFGGSERNGGEDGGQACCEDNEISHHGHLTYLSPLARRDGCSPE